LNSFTKPVNSPTNSYENYYVVITFLCWNFVVIDCLFEDQMPLHIKNDIYDVLPPVDEIIETQKLGSGPKQ
jgi:hypothetical protein